MIDSDLMSTAEKYIDIQITPANTVTQSSWHVITGQVLMFFLSGRPSLHQNREKEQARSISVNYAQVTRNSFCFLLRVESMKVNQFPFALVLYNLAYSHKHIEYIYTKQLFL